MFLYGGFYRYGYGLDPTYILVIAGVVLCMLASAKVQSTFNKYSKMRVVSGMTGAEAAERILRCNGIMDVQIERVAGNLTDHYDPGKKVLRLSDSVYGSCSISAVGVAAHECGHALQHHYGYAPLALRTMLVPVVNIGSRLAFPVIILGIILSSFDVLVPIGILLFGLTVVFSLVTLPVEFNASRRAIGVLGQQGILYEEELSGAKKVLSAAAMTYVASAVSAILQLLRIWLLYGGKKRD